MFLILLPVLLGTALFVGAQQHVGFVVNLRGDWLLNSSQTLKAGNPLPAGGIVQVRNPKRGDFIEIADRSWKTIIVKRCDSDGCDQPLKLRATASRGIFSRLFEAAMGLLAEDPARFTVLLSRGGELREAVVKIAGEQVDLSAVLADKSRGTYLLRFEPKGAGTAASSKAIGPISVDWEPNKLAPVTVKGLSPGLWMVQPLGITDRKPLEPGSESMVFFTTAETFDKTFCEFREAVILTESWGEAVHQRSKRQFLRAVLGQLASETR